MTDYTMADAGKVETHDSLTLSGHHLQENMMKADPQFVDNTIGELTESVGTSVVQVNTVNVYADDDAHSDNTITGGDLHSAGAKIHMIQHQKNLKRHTCTQCERNFAALWSLKRHLQTHSGEKPYKCELCDKSFAHSNSLKYHMTTYGDHTKEGRKCPQCEKSFKYKEKLKSHMATEHMQHNMASDQQIACLYCHQMFNSKNRLERHFQLVHESGVLREVINFEPDGQNVKIWFAGNTQSDELISPATVMENEKLLVVENNKEKVNFHGDVCLTQAETSNVVTPELVKREPEKSSINPQNEHIIKVVDDLGEEILIQINNETIDMDSTYAEPSNQTKSNVDTVKMECIKEEQSHMDEFYTYL